MRSTIRTSHATRPTKLGSRSAFTLIELVVVIMIIAILSSLLLVGIQSAIARARETAVGVEIKNLEQGIKGFQQAFSVTEAPPSRIVLYEDYDDWPDASMATGMSAAHKSIRRNVAVLRKLWPEFLNANGQPVAGAMWSRDINGDGDSTDILEMTGAECLAFFLGGVMEAGSTTGTFIAAGFSKDPRDPFKPGGSRIGPFIELNPSRLRQTAANRFPVYIDAYPNSTRPYQYFSAYGGRGYRLLGDDNATGGSDADADEIVSGTTLISPYLQKDDNWPGMMTGLVPSGTAWNAKGFQIISAGADGEWGVGGEVSAEEGVRTYDGTDTYRQNSARSKERDNITNFKGGRLN